MAKELTQKEQEDMDDKAFLSANETLKGRQQEAAITVPETKPAVMPSQPRSISTLELISYNLDKKYMNQVVNYFDGDRQSAMRFMTSAVDYVRRTPKLQECDAGSLINSLMTIASFRFMPSSVVGEAFIVPYAQQAQFQIGYKGWVTLFYRAGVKKITSDIIRMNDEYSFIDGVLSHKVDLTKSKEERGESIGAYCKMILPSGEELTKFMNGKDILAHAQRFSKSYNKPDSPWNPKNDPELNMWKKTVLLQMSNMLPKNSEMARAMDEDFKDSTIADKDRIDAAVDRSKPLSMGNFLQHEEGKDDEGAQEKVIDVTDGK